MERKVYCKDYIDKNKLNNIRIEKENNYFMIFEQHELPKTHGFKKIMICKKPSSLKRSFFQVKIEKIPFSHLFFIFYFFFFFTKFDTLWFITK